MRQGIRDALQHFYETDLALNKTFTTPVQGLKVEFRTEFYNLFNHTNLYLPGTISGTLGDDDADVGRRRGAAAQRDCGWRAERRWTGDEYV